MLGPLVQAFIRPQIRQHRADVGSGTDQQTFGFAAEAAVGGCIDADGVDSRREISHQIPAARPALALGGWMSLCPGVSKLSEPWNIEGILLI